MTELLTAAQMRAIEQAAIESGDVTGLELMERAGRGVVEAIFEEWPELRATSHRAVVLCGPGNNGGDGFVVARLLKEQSWEVEVFLYGEPEKLPPDAKENYERWREMGEVGDWSSAVDPSTRHATIVIDALFGTGLSRPIEDKNLRYTLLDLQDCFDAGAGIEVTDRPDFAPIVVAVDVPSGLCSDSGRALLAEDYAGLAEKLEASRASSELTITFHRMKIGHTLASGPEACAKIIVKDIGLPKSRALIKSLSGASAPVRPRPAPQGGGEDAPTLGPGASLVSLVERPSSRIHKSRSHKYAHGHALILSGGPGKTGAARLAARGALRIGAGLVTLGCSKAALPEVAAQVTAIMTRTIDESDALAEALKDDRLNALCIGPGLGLDDHAKSLLETALTRAERRHLVLDADALTLLSRSDIPFADLHADCVLTPHAGEFRRLFPDIAEKLDAPATRGPAYSKVDATRDAAARAGCTVLFKGPDTVIADQAGRCSINASVYDRAAPWLATAGSGDVLAGFITGLLARGFAPMQAAETAAWLHTECALSFGPGLIAEDLPEELPNVLRDLIDGHPQRTDAIPT